MTTPDDLLDLALAQRSETIRFDLLDATNARTGTLSVTRESAVVDNDVSRPIRRALGPLHIPPSDASGIDTFSDRVRPMWVLDPDDPAYQFPLGIFLFADASRKPRTSGTDLFASLVDQGLILTQKLLSTVTYDVGKNVGDALTEQFAAAGIVTVSVDATAATLTEPNVWVAGRDTRLTVMEKLCEIAGYLPPYFDNDGVGICRAAPNLATAEADFEYGLDTRMVDGTIVESDDLLAAPNLWRAVDTAPGGVLVGTYELPASAPNSRANRGFSIPADDTEIQGLADQAVADAAAQAAYMKGAHGFRWLNFDSTPDPRHDTHNILSDGTLAYLERSWRLPLTVGANMAHSARAVFS